MKPKTQFILALSALLLAFVAATMLYGNYQKKQAALVAEANNSVLVRMHAPTLGPVNAPVVIVEFLDPACGTCRQFYPLVKKMMAENPDRIRLVLRYAPFHKGSEEVVAALEAARKQGKLWPALEALLAAQSDWVQNHVSVMGLAWRHLEGLGLDFERMRADMASPEVVRAITQDIEDAKTLKVQATPEFFVNGKPLPSFGYEQLKTLVDDALSESRGR